MENGMTTLKTLMGVELYEISNNYIFKLREKQKNHNYVFNYLPKYTINTNETANNRPILAENFHQWVGSFLQEKSEKYLYFNLKTLDNNLQQEIDNSGIEDLFKIFDFKKILSFFTPHTEDDLSKFLVPTTYYLVIEITYDSSYDGFNGEYECDVIVDIIGYLNSNLEIYYFLK